MTCMLQIKDETCKGSFKYSVNRIRNHIDDGMDGISNGRPPYNRRPQYPG